VSAVPTDESEASLVQRAINHDREAFSELYNRYFARIYRYMRLRVDNQSDAEDLTETVFLNALRAIARFRPKHETSFAAWLFKLAHNAVVDRVRRTSSTAVSLENAARIPGDDASSDAETVLEWRLTVAELHQALKLLTDEQREVVLLRFVEGLSARAIGDIMGKHESAVRGMQFRAIEALRRALAGGKGASL